METAPAYFRDLALVFAAAIAGGMLAWRLRQPVILGYVLAGAFISPFTPGPSVSDLHSLELAAEFGVILLMFSVGLEFSVQDLMKARWVALIGAPLGILLSIGLALAVAPLAGLSQSEGIVAGAVVSVASTMVLTRLLVDNGKLHTTAGRIMVAITLMEDLAVVILTVIIPEMGTLQPERVGSVLADLGLTLLVLLPTLYLAARIVPRLLKRVARTRSQELFFVVVLAICMGTAALTQTVGLSLALGAFAAGLMVSGSDYAHETLSQLFPLRDAFVALFFVTIGFLIDPRTTFSNLPLLGTLLGLIVLGKLLVWTGIVFLFRHDIWTSLLVGIGLTQIGEFSFVLVQTAHKAGVIGIEMRNATLAASLISILLNAALVRYIPPYIERMRLTRLVRRDSRQAAPPERLTDHVVLCGFGRIGKAIGLALEKFSIRYVVVELDPDIIHLLRARNVPCIFGDSAHRRVLQEAGAERAAMVIVAVPEFDRARLTTLAARRLQPDIPILVRSHERLQADSFLQAGATEIVQPEFEAATTIIRRTLTRLGLPDEVARDYIRAARQQEGITP